MTEQTLRSGTEMRMRPPGTRALAALAMAAAVLGALPARAGAQLRISDPWVRATVPGQRVAAAYLTLQAAVPLRLVRVDAPVAASVQIHEMRMDGEIMKMRELKALELPAGRSIALSPGGTHLMLLDIKQPLRPGQRVQLTVTAEDGAGGRISRTLDMPVRAEPIK